MFEVLQSSYRMMQVGLPFQVFFLNPKIRDNFVSPLSGILNRQAFVVALASFVYHSLSLIRS